MKRGSHFIGRGDGIVVLLRVGCLLCTVFVLPGQGQDFDSGSTGVDGAFAPEVNTTVDLSLAGGGPGTGVYDVAAGSIVFNYTTVNIPTGVTVSFKNHPHNPPVVWLATGNVTIAGAVILDGNAGHHSNVPSSFSMPGPGGFAGGLGRGLFNHATSAGLGPGGGAPGTSGGPGGYAIRGAGALGGSSYGNPLIQPLIGGSGGGGSSAGSEGCGGTGGGGGGSGGGAILIASSGAINLITGGGTSIYANGGQPRGFGSTCPSSGGGSGGAIRLVAHDISATFNANGATKLSALGYPNEGQNPTPTGRIRLETAVRPGLTNFRGTCTPPPSIGAPGPIFPTAAFPTLRATMVDDQNVPDDPAANVLGDADVTIDTDAPVTIQIQATNIPPGTIVKVRVAPENAGPIVVDSTPLAGTPQFSTATADVIFPPGLSHVTLNTEYELSGQASTEPKGGAKRQTEGVALTHQQRQFPIRGVMNMNGRSIRRVEISSNGNPASTRVVYHPVEEPQVIPVTARHKVGWLHGLLQQATGTIMQAYREKADFTHRLRKMLMGDPATKSRTAEAQPASVEPRVQTGHPVSDASRTRASDADSHGATVNLVSYAPAQRTGTECATKRIQRGADLDPAYTYDKVHNRLTMTDPTGVTTYTYDLADRLTKIRNPSGQEISFTYDKVGRRKSMTYPNGVVTTYSYDPAGRITRITATGPGGVITDFQYTYDPAGNILTMATPAGMHSYTYDGLYQLTGATHPEPGNSAEFFTYDPAGNRLTSHLSAFHTHDAANRLLEDAGHVYTYDANGNQTSRTSKDASGQPAGEKFVFTWNADNQLIGANRYATAADASPAMTAEYIYDGLGRRLAKIVDNSVTEFVYDRYHILLELQGVGADPRQIITRYTNGPRTDEPLIMQRDLDGNGSLESSFFYHADQLGTIGAITDASGNVVHTYTYDSFGRIVAEAGDILNSYTYTAREYDPESGLCFYRSRYYDPQIGRFLREDSMRYFTGDLNLYRYVGNSTISNIDPFGLDAIDIDPPFKVPGLFDTPWYKDYCGPGGSGPALNGVDVACYIHDQDYTACGLNGVGGVAKSRFGFSECGTKADARLCQNVKLANCMGDPFCVAARESVAAIFCYEECEDMTLVDDSWKIP